MAKTRRKLKLKKILSDNRSNLQVVVKNKESRVRGHYTDHKENKGGIAVHCLSDKRENIWSKQVQTLNYTRVLFMEIRGSLF